MHNISGDIKCALQKSKMRVRKTGSAERWQVLPGRPCPGSNT